jgi:hypothetical protein
MSDTLLPSLIVERICLVDRHGSLKALASVDVSGLMFINGNPTLNAGGNLHIDITVITSGNGVIRMLGVVEDRLNQGICNAVLAAYRSKISIAGERGTP